MFFGKKLKEMRLRYAKMGLREFAKEVNMTPIELSEVERGLSPPPKCFMAMVNYVIGREELNADWEELSKLRYDPFIMQEISENAIPFPVNKKINGEFMTKDELIDLTEWINNQSKEHNKKAIEYNEKNNKSES